jgi:hypothetical protein
MAIAPGIAGAHTRSMSFSRWTFDESGATVELRIALLELTRFDGGTASPEYFATRLATDRERRAVRVPRGGAPDNRAEGWAIYRWRLRCGDGPGERAIRSHVLEEVVGTHAHFARVVEGEAEAARTLERVLTAEQPEWRLGAGDGGATRGSSVGDYAVLGVRHILEGWDHLAFVLVLILFAASFRELAIVITGFTVAHSLTLGLAALGVLRPDARAVEIHIGFSIALIAAENLWLAGGRDRAIPWLWTGALGVALGLALLGRGALAPFAWAGLAVFSICHFRLMDLSADPARLRALVSFAFGLVHGFGFAGVLMDMDLPRERLLPGLLGFNLGVEVGQLAVVALAWPVLLVLERMYGGRGRRFVAWGGSALMLALGVYWMAVRNWG